MPEYFYFQTMKVSVINWFEKRRHININKLGVILPPNCIGNRFTLIFVLGVPNVCTYDIIFSK